MEHAPETGQQYKWAVKTTMEYLNGNGDVEDTVSDIRECTSERDARDRHQAIQDTLARPNRTHPKYQRIAASALVRQPVGEWETVV